MIIDFLFRNVFFLFSQYFQSYSCTKIAMFIIKSYTTKTRTKTFEYNVKLNITYYQISTRR